MRIGTLLKDVPEYQLKKGDTVEILESEPKWDKLPALLKHDGPSGLRVKFNGRLGWLMHREMDLKVGA